jgi:hypothetical protein
MITGQCRTSPGTRPSTAEAAVSCGLAGRDAELPLEVVEQSLRAAHRARNVPAGLDVPTADRLAAELRVVGERLLDLDPGHAEVPGQGGDVLVGHEAAVLLDAPQAGEDERRLEARGIARLHPLELGNQVLHRSHSPPIM